MKIVINEHSNNTKHKSNNIDVLVLRNNCDVSEFKHSYIDVCIYSNEDLQKAQSLKNVRNFVSCGMHDFDSVTFSSMSGSSAMMCIRRAIVLSSGKIVIPCEIKSVYDNSVSVYDNLVKSLLLYLSTL